MRPTVGGAAWMGLAVLHLLGCASPGEPEPRGTRAALGALDLTRGPTVSVPPEGGDGPVQFEVRWSPGGAVFPAPATAAASWKDTAVVLDAERRLHRFDRDGAVEPIADDVSSPLVSPDGQRLAYVRGAPYGPQDVHLVAAPGQDSAVVRGVLAPNLLSFAEDGPRLHLVAAGPGGVMGLHVIDLDAAAPEARCLTNCTLRTGTDWGSSFVPLPERAEDIQGTR